MKIFLDSTDVQAIKELSQTGLIDGITTNPSLLSKIGKDPIKLIEQICGVLPEGYISVEVTEKSPEAVYKQAKQIAKIADTILVKIPCSREYFAVIHKLVEEGVRLNITLVFTLIQGMLMAKLGVEFISPFVGRWDDIDADGTSVLYDLRGMIDSNDFGTGILAASLRHVRHVHEAIEAGADAITVPVDVFEKMSEHILTKQGIEKFDADWQKLGIKQFP